MAICRMWVSLLLCVACVTHSATAMRSHSASNTSSSDDFVAAAFVCPAECLSCCQERGIMGASTTHFKCILFKAPKPSGRSCDEPVKRKNRADEPGQTKTTCEFLEGEKGAKLDKICPNFQQCCCNPLTPETQCLSMDLNDLTHVKRPTYDLNDLRRREKSALTGDENALWTPFMREEDTIPMTKEGNCKLPGNEHQVYDAVAPAQHASPEPQLVPWNKVTTGCCLETEMQHSNFSYQGTTRKYQQTWTGCKRFERTHACSDDGGITKSPNLRLYKRLAEGYYHGSWCPTPVRVSLGNECTCK